jgi:adenosylcobinamide-GDP ribazoletransferase
MAVVAVALGLGPGVAAALALAAQATLTGALHEDGLADCADGFWGGRTPERRLQIMRDSRVGSFGALALVLTVLLRWSALSALLAAGWTSGPLVAVGALSRWPMAWLLGALPPARPGGLAAAVGRPGPATLALGGAVAVLAALLAAGWPALGAALAALAAGGAWGLLARAKLGGQTGDVCGGAQQVAEVAALLALLALL